MYINTNILLLIITWFSIFILIYLLLPVEEFTQPAKYTKWPDWIHLNREVTSYLTKYPINKYTYKINSSQKAYIKTVDDIIQFYRNAIIKPTSTQIDYITSLLTNIQSKYPHFQPAITQVLPLQFVLYDGSIEFGFPFTLANSIWINANELHKLEEGTVIHEIVHILQDKYQSKFNSFYNKYWNYSLIPNDNGLYSNEILNPDHKNIKFIHNNITIPYLTENTSKTISYSYMPPENSINTFNEIDDKHPNELSAYFIEDYYVNKTNNYQIDKLLSLLIKN